MFYENLSKERKHEENKKLLEKFKDLDITKLTIEEKESIEGPIRENEAHIFFLKICKMIKVQVQMV